MNILHEDLLWQIKSRGADLAGVANLAGMHELKTGISVAVAVPPDVVRALYNGPTNEYYEAYCSINAKLDDIVLYTAEYLAEKGYKACAQTPGAVKEYGHYRTSLPHKTVATRAGIGWIGKCALLVTEEFGSAVRLSSVLTDADLPCGEPVDISRCGGCTNCKTHCPGGAVSGRLWDVSLDRDSFFDPTKCRKAARALAAQRLGKEITLCGKCIEVCPYTQRYILKSAV